MTHVAMRMPAARSLSLTHVEIGADMSVRVCHAGTVPIAGDEARLCPTR